ncbi:MAG: MFS transporter [Candidatus Bathyarchaeota archaeon]|nr:MFS transporter [Candidatus Bathyarchaeota archaeon]
MNKIAMLRKTFPRKTGINTKVAITNIVLVASAFLWYFHAFNIINMNQTHTSEALLVWGVNFAGVAGSAVLGAALVDKLGRRKPFLFYWIAGGIILSFAPLILDLTETVGLATASAVFGGYFGLGMPACMGYFSASTSTEYRSRVGGVTFLCVGLGVFLIGFIKVSDVATNTFILAAIRAIGLLILLLLKVDERPIEKEGKVSYTFILTNKQFLFYFIPWCMFSLANYMAIPVISKSFTEEIARLATIIESSLIGIFAVIGGFFADYFGRKRLAIAGFAMLGLGYAILGIAPDNPSGLYFYTVVDGVAWGSFYTIFLITLWGDLATYHNSEKYYIIGALPYLASNFIRVWIGSYIADVIVGYAVFSFAAFFLFLAVLPLVYAPETLPEKIMKERELKSYIEKAQKEATKVQKTEVDNTLK